MSKHGPPVVPEYIQQLLNIKYPTEYGPRSPLTDTQLPLSWTESKLQPLNMQLNTEPLEAGWM